MWRVQCADGSDKQVLVQSSGKQIIFESFGIDCMQRRAVDREQALRRGSSGLEVQYLVSSSSRSSWKTCGGGVVVWIEYRCMQRCWSDDEFVRIRWTSDCWANSDVRTCIVCSCGHGRDRTYSTNIRKSVFYCTNGCDTSQSGCLLELGDTAEKIIRFESIRCV